jgi:hypothetical protein
VNIRGVGGDSLRERRATRMKTLAPNIMEKMARILPPNSIPTAKHVFINPLLGLFCK